MDAIPLCLRQEQTWSDFSENKGVSPVENGLSFGFHSVQFIVHIKLLIDAIQGKDRCNYMVIT